ncbi:MAG TPA: polysaccharide pyruvyl transferase family protein [Acidimicrobiales bacterium]|nr:polysaccharide pyruvyl transferase family protein [Acidimicrobiales bacterium]
MTSESNGIPPPTHGGPRIALIGAAFSANMGAASMLRAAVTALRRDLPGAQLVVLTTYPEADRLEPDLPPEIEIVDLRPERLALVDWPLSLLSGFLRQVGVPSDWLLRTKSLRAMARADVVVDLAGISFVDGRGIPTLVYNTMMTSAPVALGSPVVKMSQAMGPLRRRSTRLAARFVLPRLKRIAARGRITHCHLEEFGLDNVIDAADVAFLMETSTSHKERAQALVPPRGAGLRVGIVPSQVVRQYQEADGGDYMDLMTRFLLHLESKGHSVALLPHAIQSGRPAGKMNDLPLVRELAEKATVEPPSVENVGPEVLREAIAACDVVVTSRFHAMVSALATDTPTVVLGWSHKYREVLDQFDQADAAVDYRGVTLDRLVETFNRVTADLPSRRMAIAEHRPQVEESARANIEAVRVLL